MVSVTYIGGVVLALGTSFMNACGLSLQKKAHKRRLENETKAALTSGGQDAAPRPYFRDPLWLLGLTFMIIGSVASLGVFALLGQSRSACFASVTIVWNAILSYFVLHERLTAVDAFVAATILAGSITSVIFGSVGAGQQAQNTLDVLIQQLSSRAAWSGALVVLSLFTLCYLQLKWQAAWVKEEEDRQRRREKGERNRLHIEVPGVASSPSSMFSPGSSAGLLQPSPNPSPSPSPSPSPVLLSMEQPAQATWEAQGQAAGGSGAEEGGVSARRLMEEDHTDSPSVASGQQTNLAATDVASHPARAPAQGNASVPAALGGHHARQVSASGGATRPVRTCMPPWSLPLLQPPRMLECAARALMAGLFSGTTGICSKMVVVGIVAAVAAQDAKEVLTRWQWYLALLGLPTSLVLQVHMLNSALSRFSALEAVPLYQTAVSLTGIAFGWTFFGESAGVSPLAMTMFLIGGCISCVGVCLLLVKARLVSALDSLMGIKAVSSPPPLLPLSSSSAQEVATGAGGQAAGPTKDAVEALESIKSLEGQHVRRASTTSIPGPALESLQQARVRARTRTLTGTGMGMGLGLGIGTADGHSTGRSSSTSAHAGASAPRLSIVTPQAAPGRPLAVSGHDAHPSVMVSPQRSAGRDRRASSLHPSCPYVAESFYLADAVSQLAEEALQGIRARSRAGSSTSAGAGAGAGAGRGEGMLTQEGAAAHDDDTIVQVGAGTQGRAAGRERSATLTRFVQRVMSALPGANTTTTATTATAGTVATDAGDAPSDSGGGGSMGGGRSRAATVAGAIPGSGHATAHTHLPNSSGHVSVPASRVLSPWGGAAARFLGGRPRGSTQPAAGGPRNAFAEVRTDRVRQAVMELREETRMQEEEQAAATAAAAASSSSSLVSHPPVEEGLLLRGMGQGEGKGGQTSQLPGMATTPSFAAAMGGHVRQGSGSLAPPPLQLRSHARSRSQTDRHMLQQEEGQGVGAGQHGVGPTLVHAASASTFCSASLPAGPLESMRSQDSATRLLTTLLSTPPGAEGRAEDGGAWVGVGEGRVYTPLQGAAGAGEGAYEGVVGDGMVHIPVNTEPAHAASSHSLSSLLSGGSGSSVGMRMGMGMGMGHGRQGSSGKLSNSERSQGGDTPRPAEDEGEGEGRAATAVSPTTSPTHAPAPASAPASASAALPQSPAPVVPRLNFPAALPYRSLPPVPTTTSSLAQAREPPGSAVSTSRVHLLSHSGAGGAEGASSGGSTMLSRHSPQEHSHAPAAADAVQEADQSSSSSRSGDQGLGQAGGNGHGYGHGMNRSGSGSTYTSHGTSLTPVSSSAPPSSRHEATAVDAPASATGRSTTSTASASASASGAGAGPGSGSGSGSSRHSRRSSLDAFASVRLEDLAQPVDEPRRVLRLRLSMPHLPGMPGMRQGGGQGERPPAAGGAAAHSQGQRNGNSHGDSARSSGGSQSGR